MVNCTPLSFIFVWLFRQTPQKMKFSIKNFFSFLEIFSCFIRKFLIENFIFCTTVTVVLSSSSSHVFDMVVVLNEKFRTSTCVYIYFVYTIKYLVSRIYLCCFIYNMNKLVYVHQYVQYELFSRENATPTLFMFDYGFPFHWGLKWYCFVQQQT